MEGRFCRHVQCFKNCLLYALRMVTMLAVFHTAKRKALNVPALCLPWQCASVFLSGAEFRSKSGAAVKECTLCSVYLILC